LKKKNGYILIVSFVLMVMPLSLSAMEYQYKLEVKKMQFSWTIEKDKIHVKLKAKTKGWVSIGFEPEKAMLGANIIIGMVKDGQVEVQDHYGVRKRGHKSDTALGGTSDVLNPSGSEEKGITAISFTFPLHTGDKWDKAINPDVTGIVMLAYGTGKDSFKTRHQYRTIYEINFSTGENKKLK